MREIKFRYTCQRSNGHIFHHDFTMEQLVNGEGKLWNTINGIGGADKTFWRQFTGLKDKNGREIYEGDILNAPAGKFTVEWKQAGFITKQIGYSNWGNMNDSETPYIEVVGNIYENPTLIKGGNNDR